MTASTPTPALFRRPAPASEPGPRVRARWSPVLVFAAWIAVCAGAGPVPELAAQTGTVGAATACALGGSDELGQRCIEGALAAEALLTGFGRLAAAGGALPASPSTVGWRVDGVPRMVFEAGGAFVSVRHPELQGAGVQGGIAERRSLLRSARLTATAGIFDGFFLAPTVGGVGSLDGVLTARLLAPPGGAGFDGSTSALGAGVRLGIFRESFSLPGITLTGTHHWIGTVRYGSLPDDRAAITLEPRVSSLRLEAGKDMMAFGATGGVGWDQARARARISATDAQGATGTSGSTRLEETRTHFFLGMNYTWLISQVSGELAWSPGGGGTPELAGVGPFRPGRPMLTGTIGWRVIY